jgi:hypothetical protein
VAGNIIVECTFNPALGREEFDAHCERLADCFRVRFVEWRGKHFAKDGSRALLVAEAADSETVRNALRSAGVPFDKVWPAAEEV